MTLPALREVCNPLVQPLQQTLKAPGPKRLSWAPFLLSLYTAKARLRMASLVSLALSQRKPQLKAPLVANWTPQEISCFSPLATLNLGPCSVQLRGHHCHWVPKDPICHQHSWASGGLQPHQFTFLLCSWHLACPAHFQSWFWSFILPEPDCSRHPVPDPN